MAKPELSGMTNRDAIQNGFHDIRKIKYTVTPEIIKNLAINNPEYKDYCSGGYSLINADTQQEIKKIPFNQFTANASFDVSDKYNGK